MASSRDRLRLAPDDHSDTERTETPVGRSPEKGEGPAEVLRRQALERGRGRHTSPEGAGLRRHTHRKLGKADMQQSSRPPWRATSGTQCSAVKITPASSAGHTTTTPTTR